jgi:hypothetical protein
VFACVCSSLLALVRSYPPRFGEAVADMAHGLLGRATGQAVTDVLEEPEQLIANLHAFLNAGIDDYWEDVWSLYRLCNCLCCTSCTSPVCKCSARLVHLDLDFDVWPIKADMRPVLVYLSTCRFTKYPSWWPDSCLWF